VIRYQFVPVGTVREAEAGIVAVDVGGKCIPGVIDHHFGGVGEECAASLVAREPGLVLDHVQACGPIDTVVMHREPDLDCLVAAYLVERLARDGALPSGSMALAEYTRRVDAGQVPDGEALGTSLWGLYTASIHLLAGKGDRAPDPRSYEAWLQRGFGMLDRIAERAPTSVEGVRIPEDVPGYHVERRFVREDAERYANDRQAADVRDIDLPCIEGGRRTESGLVVTDPTAFLFKQLARADGFVYTHVRYSGARAGEQDGDSPTTRHVISVAPHCGIWLKGLGAVLEGEEVAERARGGRARGGQPRWADVTSDDPWYDGRSPLHRYTIVDTPRGGTLLDPDAVVRIALDTDRWIPLGESTAAPFCPQCGFEATAGEQFCPTDGRGLLNPLVAGRYEVIALRGQGGMGTVFEVAERCSGERLALKLMKQAYLSHEVAPRRFFREALVGNRLRHPNLMHVVDVGGDARSGLYMVSELLEGQTLARAMAGFSGRDERLPPHRVGAIALQICDALHALHDVGVVHRDLKPDNVMLIDTAHGEQVKLMDFGVAAETDLNATRLTTTGHGLGTPLYGAPEQLTGEGPISSRADIYSLGVVLYEMLSGVPPYADSQALISLVFHKASSQPPLLTEMVPDLGVEPPIVDLVARMLAGQPQQRPGSTAEVRDIIASSPALCPP